MAIEIILKLLLSAVLGGIIGLEREISHKESGLRVNVLIAIGTALMTSLGLLLVNDPADSDLIASPYFAHIITALGIIGAGIIVRERFAAHGMTSAAALWCVGGVGMTVGLGEYLVAFAITIFITVTLVALKKVTAVVEKQGKYYAYVITCEDRASIILEIKKIVRELGLKYIGSNMRKAGGGYVIEIALNASENKNKVFIERVMHLPDVLEISSENL